MKTIAEKIIYFILFIMVFSCKEPFEIESITFEDALVVEGTITNEMKNQEINISRTFLLNENEPAIENNAQVRVEDSQQNIYTFSQDTTGKYISNIPFMVQENITYKLFITTNDGKRYESLNVELTPTSTITRLYAEFDPVDDNVKVFVDSDNENSETQFFRYEYEETFKIVAPKFEPTFNAEIINLDTSEDLEILLTYDIILVPKTQQEQQEQICFTTDKSFGIRQTSTTELDNNVVFRFPVRIINKDDSILRERYSILVKQFVQSIESHTFYRIINELGGIESLLSENQPGFVAGNIISPDNESEKVLGFFEVASVSSKRIYFDYTDFNLSKPMYFYDCEYSADPRNVNHLRLDYSITGLAPGTFPERLTLFQLLTNSNYKYWSNAGGAIYFIVSPECGDCTSFSSNIIPDFWED